MFILISEDIIVDREFTYFLIVIKEKNYGSH